MRHAARTIHRLDPKASGEDAAYVLDAQRFLERVLNDALERDEPGDQGDADLALSLVALLADRLDEDALEYVTDLFSHAATRVADRHRHLM